MRYEDASQTGAFQGQGPIANDDLEMVPAGSKNAATGNLITGEGTQSGTAGADSAAGAHITAIAGKGGEDSSFAGGKLSVSGEFGRLSVDADGNYVYVVNQGVENVRDRFNYTLADNAGASDTAALIVEIGKTPVVIKADAQQIVPGPDGVVTLPPGVELSDVHVVGRNLVVDLPDGTQLIIIDGAVFVPQLVLGGVEVPATNVAALLIGQEIQPAAGETPPSSGGNFALPPPPLDPGVPLGDLLPPTEYVFTPPDVEDVGQFIDREPEISIQPDGQPASAAAVDSVEEAGLPTRNGNLPNEPAGSGESADGNGADNDVTSETTSGVIHIDSPDGVDSVTINGHLVTGVIGQTIPGAFGTLTITGFAGNDIQYSYTLNDNTSGNNTHDDFSVTLTDDDGDQATATLRIDIVDDVPTARPDTDAIASGQFGPVTGNVITDASAGDDGDSDSGADTVGADNASITAVSSANVPANSDSGAPFVVNGQYGVLTLQADGSYSYTRNPGTPGGVQDVFNYTLTDGDGDTSSTTLTITIADATPQTGQNPTARTDDDAVPGANGNPGGPEDDVDAQNLSGNLAGSGGDGPLTFDLLLTGAPAGFSYVDGPGGSVLVQQVQDGVTVTVLTITINPATGAYTVTQNAPIEHPSLDGQTGDDTENNVSFTINYNVTDVDGDSAAGTLAIDVDDDTPVALVEVQVGGTVDEDGVVEGADDGGDGDGNPGGVEDVAGENTVVQGNVSALFSSGADQPLTYSLLTDTSGLPALTSNGAPVTYSVVGNTLTASANGQPVFTLVLNGDTGAYTFTLLDQLDHPSLDGQPGDDTENPSDSDLTIQLGAIIQATDSDGDSVTADANGLNIIVDDDSPEEFEECPDDVIAINDVGSTFTGDLNLPPVGADEPGTVSFVVDDGAPVLDTEGNPVTSNGEALFYFVNDQGVLEARAGDATGDVIFTITINGDGTFTYNQVGEITSVNVISITDLSSVGGGNVDAKAIDVPDSPFDLILTTQPGNTVNTNATEMGVDTGNSLEAGEILRVDLVQNAFVTGSGGGAVLNFGEYYTANSYRQDVSGLGGPQRADFIVRAIAVNEAGAGPADGDNVFFGDANDTVVATTQLNLYDDNGVLVDPADYAGLGITVSAAVGGGWLITGLPNDYDFEITSATAFNAVQIEAVAGTDTFKLGFIDITTTVQSDVALSIPIALTDADGDSVVCDIDVILGPPLNVPDVGVTVDEAGLPAGSDPGSTSETQSGDLQGVVTGGVGPYTFALVGSGDGAFGTLTLNPDGTFSYTLDTPVDSQPDANDGTNTEPGVEVFTFEATDANGITSTGTITVNVIDDVPSITLSGSEASLTVDETVLATNATASFASAFSNVPGADGAASITYALGISAPGANSGLIDVATGSAIVLVLNGGVVEGHVGNAAGPLAFTVSVDGSGNVTLDQIRAVTHPNPANPDDSVTLGADNLVSLTATITDNDGDQDSTTLNIGQNLNFEDDGPSITLSGTEASLTVDETNLAANAGPTSFASAFTPVFGADGAAAANSLTYALSITGGNGVASGLIDVATGQPIVLVLNGGVVEGHVGNAAGALAFTVTVDASGGVSLDQLRALSHPNAANPDDSVTLAADNLIVLTATATDRDGDTASVGLNIGQNLNFEDDGPSANNDTDTTNPATDTAVGNVITGVGTTEGAGNADQPGADGFGAITNLVGSTTSDSDPAGGFTAVGTHGTLQMDANGQYTYTRTGGAGGQTDSFTYTYVDRDGDPATATLVITISDQTPTAGNVNVQLDDDALANGNPGGPNGTDDPDAVNVSGNLPGGGGNAPLTWALLTTGAPAGFSYVGGGTSVQVFQGATHVATITLTDPATGAYTVTQVAPIVHAPGADENNVSFTINYTVTDADTDVANGTISVNIDDDTPVVSASSTQPQLTVDETVLATNASASFAGVFTNAFGADGPAVAGSVTYALAITGGNGVASGLVDVATGQPIVLVNNAGVIEGHVGNAAGALAFTVTVDAAGTVTLDQIRAVTHPNTADPDDSVTLSADNLITLSSTITDRDGDTATATANIGQNLNFEDDGPTISASTTQPQLTVDETNLAVNANASFAAVFTSAFGADGAGTLNYALSITGGNGVASGLVDVATGQPIVLVNNAGVIEGHVGNAAGALAFTVTVDAAGNVTLDQARAVTHPNTADPDDSVTLSADNLVVLTATVTDRDGDQQSASANIGQNLNFEDDGPTISASTTQPQLTVDETVLATDASASFAGVFTSAFGADGAGTITYALGITGGDGVDSGLDDVATGQNIVLVNNAGVIEGRVGNAAGALAFTVTVDGSGNVTLDQIRAVTHPNTANPDDSVTLSADNLITLTATVTDRDGDSQSATANIGQNLNFEDDGPSAAVSSAGFSLSHDETPGLQDTDVAGPIAAFAGVGNPGDDPHVAGTVIGYATSTGAISSTGTTFGADGGTAAFSLNVSAAGVDSGLNTTEGTDILLYKEGDLIVGRVGSQAGPAAFALSIDPTTGVVSMVQYLSIQHPNAANPDDSVSIANGAVLAVVTATDGDGDTSTASTGIGSLISFQDDGPSTYEPADAALTNAPGAATHFNLDAFAGDGDIGNNFGADGPGVVRFPSSVDNSNSGLTSGGVTIWYILDPTGTILQGRTGVDAATAEASGTLIFTITIDQANDRYTIDMDGTVDAFTEINFNDGSYDFVGGNDTWAGFVPVGQEEGGAGDVPLNDDSRDLLLTPIGTGTAVNGNANSAGTTGPIAGQNIGQGEGMRLDFVEDLTGIPTPGDYADPGEANHDFDGHYDINGAVLRFGDGTSTLTTASFKAYRVDPQVIDDNGDDGTADPVAGTGDLVSVTSIAIIYDGETETVNFDPLDLDNTQTVTVGSAGGLPDRTYTVEFVLDAGSGEWYAEVTGIYDINVRIATFAETNYHALEILHLGPSSSDADFAITGFGAAVQSTDPVLVSLPTEIVDGDGDVVGGGDIDITLNPPGQEALVTKTAPSHQSSDDSFSSLSYSSSNDNQQWGGNLGNTGIVAGIVAASGLSSAAGAVSPGFDSSFDVSVQDTMQVAGLKSVQPAVQDGLTSSLSFGSELSGPAFDMVSLPGSSHSFADFGQASFSLDAQSFANVSAYQPNFAVDQAPAFGGASAFTAVAPAVGMVSAEALAAAGGLEGLQQGKSIGHVVADALGLTAAPTVDALLQGLPGGGGMQAGDFVAIPGIDQVPGWDMGMAGAFGSGHNMMFVMDALVLHQDAVQPTLNG